MQYKSFLGKWALIKGSCVYEQGLPPLDGHYIISVKTKDLLFEMIWIDHHGERQEFRFRGRPNGLSFPFSGGELADSLTTEIISERELNTKAFKDDIKVMEVKRTLSNSLKQMTISQTVFLPDFNKLTNWSSYSKIIIQ
ncbi:MAG: hypothetical protein P8J83_08440 [Paracoccaceae bacterium]|nr:hypothetical protein [Paracoccaceae bacterium]